MSLASHLTSLVASILDEHEALKPDELLRELENISIRVKQTHATQDDADTPPTHTHSNGLPTNPPTRDAVESHKRSLKLLKAPLHDHKGLQNLLHDAALFEWGAVGLPRTESVRLAAALSALRAEHGFASVRFFGKILGTASHYYVVEGTYASPPPAAAAAAADADASGLASSIPAEAPGTGLNMHAYLVSSSPSSPFVLLPDTTPTHIVAATAIKKYLTGHLDAPVACWPPFPGAERHLLRAQIARIAAATVVVPAGMLVVDEESEETPAPIVDAEEYEPREAAEMVELDAWCHRFPGILKIGRCTHPPPPPRADGGDDDDDDEPEEVEHDEEEVAALAPLSADGDVSEPLPDVPTPSWTFALHAAGSVAVGRSNRWPGAWVASAKGKHACLYIGYGYEEARDAHTPAPFPKIASEEPDLDEEDEVPLDDENKLLKELDDARLVAEAEEGEEGGDDDE